MSVGEKIRLHRCARGWSLDELASRMQEIAEERAITKQALSKYESGKMSPSPKILNLLGRVFHVKSASLLEESDIRVTNVAYRKKLALSRKDELAVQAQVKLFMEVGLRLQFAFGHCLGEVCALPKYRVENLREVEHAAGQLRTDWLLGMDPISNMTDLLVAHNIHVLVLPLEFTEIDGVSSWVSQGSESEASSAVVAVRSGITINRHRFTLAHELGHILLNCPLSADIDEESACYRFAGALLVPEESLKADFGDKTRTVSWAELLSIKERHRISIQCLLRRLEELELISTTHYNDWRSYIRKNDFENEEPGDERCSEPAFLAKIWVTRALKEGIINRQDANVYLVVAEKVLIPQAVKQAEAVCVSPASAASAPSS